jgi:anti-sigma B factor antagonist
MLVPTPYALRFLAFRTTRISWISGTAPMMPHFRLETIDGITVVTFTAAKVVPEMKDPLYGLVGDEGHRWLLLDLSNVRFLSSHALGILVSLKKKVDAAGGRLRLCCLEPDLLELLRITSLDRIFETSESREEALKGF